MHAYIVTVGAHTFPLISLRESRAPHSIAQEIINTRRSSPLNAHRYPIRDAIRAAHDEWDVPLEPLDEGDEIRVTDSHQGVHTFWVWKGFADTREREAPEVFMPLAQMSAGDEIGAAKLWRRNPLTRSADA